MGAAIETFGYSEQFKQSLQHAVGLNADVQGEGNLRAEMGMQLAAAQADMEARIAELQRSGSAVPASVMAEAQSQLAGLSALQRSLNTASPAMLQSLREHVIASVAAANATSQQAREVANSSERVQATRQQTIAEINRTTRDSVTSIADDIYEKRIFDQYLNFTSPQEAAAYREREAENKNYIQEQLGKNTTEGNLNAAAATTDQLLDAGAHGAGKSPDFAPRLQRMRETFAEQRAAAKAEGVSTAEADQKVETGVRRLLRKRGVPEAEITTKLRAAENPLDVAESYIEDGKEAPAPQVVRESEPQKPVEAPPAQPAPAEPVAAAATTPAAAAPEAKASPAPTLGDAKLMAELGALAAALKGSGVTLTDAGKTEGHGLSGGNIAQSAGRGL